MSSECRNDCIEAILFPKTIYNRPGLAHIDYRIGTYCDFREALMRSLNLNTTLANWTHRKADDTGIALLEGVSILGDILTFYQELYANEAFLRTAQWRESVSDLVRLLGYRLSPGLGGSGTFAFEVKGDNSVTVPAGFPLKAEVEGADKPVDFETEIEIEAFPHLSNFRLYRPRNSPAFISSGSGQNKLEIHTVDGGHDLSSINSVELQEGDRIMLVPDATMFDVTGASYITQKKAEILVVSEVQKNLDCTTIIFEGALIENRGAYVTAYRIGRSFRHFGHNAPIKITKYDSSEGKVVQERTHFLRQIYRSESEKEYYSGLSEVEMPLAEEVDDLAAGGKIICQGITEFDDSPGSVPFTVVKEITNLHSDTLIWGNLTGASTVVTVKSKLIANDFILNKEGDSDIRKLQFHEVTSPELTLRALTEWNSGEFTGNTLNYFGTYEEVLALAGRELLCRSGDDVIETVTIESSISDFSLSGKDEIHPWMWPIIISPLPAELLLEDFDEENPAVTVYGNLASATQGKTEKEAVLGNGDNRQIFQTFKLPKVPLTYLISPDETPPEVPELQIYVNDRLWERVPSFFNRKPDEEIYVVREDAEDNSWVQFGDGNTGARLPSGIKNVKAVYRTGISAFGAKVIDTKVQATGKLKQLDKIELPGVISGGSQAESGENAQEAAPGKVQSLNRLVSIKDFESETLSISGVIKASAAWGLSSEGIPSVLITILMESERAAEVGAVEEVLRAANRCRGTQRFPVQVISGDLQYIYVDITYGYDSTYRRALLDETIKEALGLTGEEGNGIEGASGLLGIKNRRFGEAAYATRIEGTVQNVEGVVWAKVTALGSLGVGGDPSELDTDSIIKVLNPAVQCELHYVLSLYTSHLQLNASVVEAEEVC